MQGDPFALDVLHTTFCFSHNSTNVCGLQRCGDQLLPHSTVQRVSSLIFQWLMWGSPPNAIFSIWFSCEQGGNMVRRTGNPPLKCLTFLNSSPYTFKYIIYRMIYGWGAEGSIKPAWLRGPPKPLSGSTPPLQNG